MISVVRAYERRGAVWSDHIILARTELVARLTNGKHFMTGQRKEYLGSVFENGSAVHYVDEHIFPAASQPPVTSWPVWRYSSVSRGLRRSFVWRSFMKVVDQDPFYKENSELSWVETPQGEPELRPQLDQGNRSTELGCCCVEKSLG